MGSISFTTNPYTAHLLAQLPPGRVDDVAIAAFVADWDRLEAFVIRVFRAGAAGAEDASEWVDLRTGLDAQYDAVADPLAPHWALALVSGERCAEDPFRSLLAVPTASAFVDNRTAMRTLPAAREALNRWLVALKAGNADIDADVVPLVTPPAAPPAPARPSSAGTWTDPAA